MAHARGASRGHRGVWSLMVLVVVWAALAAPAAGQGAPQAVVRPDSGPAGTVVDLGGCGWPSGVAVTVTWEPSGATIGSGAANASGCLSGSATVPADAPVGQHRVRVAAPGAAVAFASFTVTESSPPPPPPPPGEGLPDPRLPGLLRLRAESQGAVEVVMRDSFPEVVSALVPVAGADPVERAMVYLASYDDLYGQDHESGRLTLQPRRASHDPDGQHVLLQQYVDGVRVFGGQVSVLLDGDMVLGTVGRLMVDDPTVDVAPGIAEADAPAAARAALGAPADAPVLGLPELLVFDAGAPEHGAPAGAAPAPTLAWQVTVVVDGLPVAVLVDAHEGTWLYSHALSQSAYDLDLEDAFENTPDWHCFAFTSTDQAAETSGPLPAYEDDADVIAGWQLSQEVYDFFNGHFEWDSYNDGGNDLDIFVHSPVPGTAGWIDACGMWVFNTGAVVEDVVAHEYTHAIIRETSDLIYANQSGALNESFADIFAAQVDASDWLIGEDLTGPTLRDMSNLMVFPGNAPFSNNPQGGPGGNDNGGVHTNSGVQNHAAYLMAEGDFDQNGTVDGFGRVNLRRLAWHVMRALPDNATMSMSAQMFRSRAAYLESQGIFADEDVCVVRNAFSVVGLLDGDLDCDGLLDDQDPDNDGDTVPDGEDNCPARANPGQLNADGDGLGDVCDPDADGDGVDNEEDNCVLVPNAGQGDSDGDDRGDACDDGDNDAVIDSQDNCPNKANGNQDDLDGDGEGDACDDDKDGDGVEDGDDNCPDVANADQQDTDEGGIGDACDPTPNDPLNDFIATLSEANAGFTEEVSVTGVEELVVELCGGGCPENWLSPDVRVRLDVGGLPAGVRAAVTHLDGTMVAEVQTAAVGLRQEGDALGAATWSPSGDGRYLLRLVSLEGTAEFTLELAARTSEGLGRVERVAGPDRFATAAAVSAAAFPLGAEIAYLATGEQFADALAGAPAAAGDGAPVLLTRAGDLPEATVDELRRLGAGGVVILGGEAAVGADVAAAVESMGIEVLRAAGTDRFATAASIAGRAFPDGADEVVLATGAEFADALAGGAAAAQRGAPVLLVQRDAVPAATRDALAALGATRAVVLGGEAAVAPSVVAELEDLGLTVERVGGADRYATAAAIADFAHPDGAAVALLATGERFPDALAAGAAAAALDAPVLLSSPDQLPDSTAARLPAGPGTRTILLGGLAALSSAVEAAVVAAVG